MDFPELGRDWYGRFASSTYSLRFELGGEEFNNQTQSVPRFVQAFDRARCIADDLFQSICPLIAIVGFWTLEKRELVYRKRKKDKNGLDILKAMGFESGLPVAEWLTKPPGTEEGEDYSLINWAAFDVSNNKTMRDVLIWGAITREMLIEPKVPAEIYLYSPKTEAVMGIYDDRGMDIKALTAEPLLGIYQDFDKWLLDYDRPRITAAFSSTTS